MLDTEIQRCFEAILAKSFVDGLLEKLLFSALLHLRLDNTPMQPLRESCPALCPRSTLQEFQKPALSQSSG